MIPDLRVEIVDYLDKEGRFVKLKTRKSVLEYADRAEENLNRIIDSYPEGTKTMAVGHSLGAIILRILVLRGHNFKELIFAGGPFHGFSRKYIFLLPLAAILRIKLFFELCPGSDFLKSLGQAPPGIYVGSKIDEKVSSESAIPEEANKRIYLCCCGHDMFPKEKEKVSNSAIPVVAEIIEKYVNKSQ